MMGYSLEKHKLIYGYIDNFGLFIGLVLTIVGGVIIGLDIIGGIVAFIRSRKEKGSDIEEKMKKVLLLSIVLLISGLFLFIVFITLFFICISSGGIWALYPIFLFFFLIGLLIGFIGLYGIRLYRSKPEKLRNYLLNRRKISDRFRPKTASK